MVNYLFHVINKRSLKEFSGCLLLEMLHQTTRRFHTGLFALAKLAPNGAGHVMHQRLIFKIKVCSNL